MSDQLGSIELTPEKIRHLSAVDLGLLTESPPVAPAISELVALDDEDPILAQVNDLLQAHGGIIFVGPPGTSKSWYAARAGVSLVAGNLDRLRFVQFHPSYQYEDFVEGFVPEARGGFRLRSKHFLEMCQRARAKPTEAFVIVIDELSRGDPGRVFGEALTYVERSKRGISFQLASGTECVVPENLAILATMNPLDRGVDEVDAALERRFAKVALDPDPALLARFLTEAGMSDSLRDRVLKFFTTVNSFAGRNPHAAIGHTYFIGVTDEDDLRRLWQHQLRFHFDKAYRLDPDGRRDLDRLWNEVISVASADEAEEGEPKE